MILQSLLLQKPSATSKSKDHSLFLEQRLQMWSDWKINEIWKDRLVIQKKLTARPQRSQQDIPRTLSKLMFEGRVGSSTEVP